MLIKTRGIVFRTKKYSETSVIADIFTEAKGLRSYIISGVRSQNSKISAGLLQIMSAVELVVYHREDRDLTRLQEIKPWYIYQKLPFEVPRSAVGMFMVDIARKTIRGHEEHPELFDFLLEAFVYLDHAPNFANLHLHFMLKLTEHLGFTPGGFYNEKTSFFDLREGVFVSFPPPGVPCVRAELSEKLSGLLHCSKEESHLIQLLREQRKELLKSLLDFYRLHIENFPQVHSHEILEEVLG